MKEKKKCNKCGEEKELCEYYISKRTKDGFREFCKMCISIYNKEQNVKRKNPNYIKKTKKRYDENFFEVIDTEDKAYFLGFIYADGCLINNDKKSIYEITIKINNKDDHILIKLIKKINGEMKLWYNKKREMCEIRLNGKKIVSDLENKGVHPNKTFTIKYPVIDEKLERHFLRGYFDGDGCIRINTDKRDGSKRGDLRIVGGSIDMLNKINERMNLLFNTNINKLYGPENKEFKYVGWAGMTDIEKIYNGFYNNSNLFLTRKKLIFDNVISEIKNKTKYRKK
jgi:hypothetical protein